MKLIIITSYLNVSPVEVSEMNMLVLGGSKFIGLHLVMRLLEYKFNITVFNRGNSNELLPDSVYQIKGDRKDHKLIRELFKDLHFDVVFDISGYDPEDIEIFIDVLNNKIKQYVFCSGIAVYDFNILKSLPIKEEFQLKYNMSAMDHEAKRGFNKVLCEKKLLSNGCFPVTILRPSYVYGPYAYDYRIEYFFDRIIDNRMILIPPICDNIAHFIHVEDLAEMFLASVGNDKAYNQVYNAVGDEVLTIKEFIILCEKIIGKRADIMEYDLGTLPSILTRIEIIKITPTKIYPISIYFDNSKVKRELNWKQKYNLFEGLKNTYEWHMKHRNKLIDYGLDDKLLNGLIEFRRKG